MLMMDEEINNLLLSIMEENGISEYNVIKGEGSEKGDGYTSTITTVDICGKHDKDHKNTEKDLHLVVKSIVKVNGSKQDACVATQFICDREIYAYNTVLPTFHAFEQEKGHFLPLLSPKFYKSIASNALILENLKCSGFSLYDRQIAMDEKHVRLVMEQYGRFHALSLALRDQNGIEFTKITRCMEDIFHNDYLKRSFTYILTSKCTHAKAFLDPQVDEGTFKTYETFSSSIEEFIGNLGRTSDEHSVILHGDCWTNNMMFKYEDQSDASRPTHVTFFDFQLMRVGSPVLDLSYFFYTCSSKEIISELDRYLQIYYDSFSKHLKQLGSDPEKLFPYSILKEHWKKYARYGLLFSILVLYIMLSDKSEVPDFYKSSNDGKKESLNYAIANLQKYQDRVKDIILHFVMNKFI